MRRTITHIDPQHTTCTFWGGCRPNLGYHWVKRNGEWWVERLPQKDYDFALAYKSIEDADAAMKAGDYSRAIGLLNTAPQGTPKDPLIRERLAIAWEQLGLQAWKAGDYSTARQRFENATHYSSDELLKKNLDIAQRVVQQRRDQESHQATLDEGRALIRAAAEARSPEFQLSGGKLQFVTDPQAFAAPQAVAPNKATASHDGSSSTALQQAYSADAAGKKASDARGESGTFTGAGMKAWDNAGDKVNTSPVIVQEAQGTPVIPSPPAALKANPVAFAKYQELQAHREALQKQSQDLEKQLASVRKQQATGQGDAAKLLIDGVNIKQQIDNNTAAMQLDVIKTMDLSFSFEEGSSPSSKTSGHLNAPVPPPVSK